MITDAILSWIYGVVYWILTPVRALPTATLPSGFTTSIAMTSGYLATLYSILPLTCIALITIGVVMILAYEAPLVAYKIVMWVVKKIPGIS